MTVFLSYSNKDHFFAELVGIKLEEAGITLWRDRGMLIPGTDWRQGIESGISNCIATLVALSQSSADSAYVTYEWAYAIGKGKPVIPLKISDCNIHPRLTTIQHLDFTVASALPWQSLIDRIKEIETEDGQTQVENLKNNYDDSVKAILDYLNQRGFQMMSFERIRQQIDPSFTDEKLSELISKNKTIFRSVMVKGKKKGIGKILP